MRRKFLGLENVCLQQEKVFYLSIYSLHCLPDNARGYYIDALLISHD